MVNRFTKVFSILAFTISVFTTSQNTMADNTMYKIKRHQAVKKKIIMSCIKIKSITERNKCFYEKTKELRRNRLGRINKIRNMNEYRKQIKMGRKTYEENYGAHVIR